MPAVLWLSLILLGAPAPAAEPMVEAFEAGQLTRALKMAKELSQGGTESAEALAAARLVIAFGALKRRRLPESDQALKQLSSEGPDLGPYLLYLRAAVAAARRHCDKAEAIALEVPDASVYAAPTWSRITNCRLRARQLEQARAAVARVEASARDGSHRAEAALAAARIEDAAGHLRRARDLYRAVLVGFPLYRAGRRARARLEEIRNQGFRVAPLAPEELLPRAEKEQLSLNARRARRTYSTIIRGSRWSGRWDLRNRAELGLVELDMVGKRYGRALRRLARVVKSAEEPDILAHALFLRGDVLSRRGRVTAAIEAFEEAMAEFQGEPYAAEGALAAARLAFGAGNLDGAEHFAQWLLEQPEPEQQIAVLSGDGQRTQAFVNAGLRDNARWLLAWVDQRRGLPHTAMTSHLMELARDGPFAEAGLYWRARLAVDAGDFEAGEALAALLRERAPTSYYTLAVTDLLADKDPSCPIPAPVAAMEEALGADVARPQAQAEDMLGAQVLLEHGLLSEAQRVVRLQPASILTRADRVIAAWIYRRCGDVHRSAILARRAAKGPRAEVQDPVLLDLAFPRPFEDIVEQMGAHYDVPTPLIYAVMREESGFNPKAVSPRKARGLMQMIQPTALRIASEASVRRFHVRKLFNPEIAIQLGTHYLADLLALFDGNIPAAIASYHAGERAVGRWLNTRREMRFDEFIEDIPYSTTRAYVKKVLSSYGVYRLLYAESAQQAIGLTDAGGGQ